MIETQRKNCRSIVRPAIITMVVLLVVGYSALKLKDFALGPEISLNSPTEGENLKTDLVIVKGKAERISQIFINGRKIFTDEEGNFDEPYLLASGYNLLEIMAQDKFGRKIEKKVQLVYQNNNPDVKVGAPTKSSGLTQE